ncbi:DrmB family protein [Kitasatospora sp. NPDC057965]|uniref:DrmB family protein n=1 Tax=Kitasatospora sp. NPDC057965 TaxID=3346291 RepID=UPI0036DA823A
MSPLPPRTRRRGPLSAPVRAARRLGEIRRAQFVTTYGVGAMIAVENESFLVRGTDSWDMSEAVTVWEPRLARQLGVNSFRLPPAPDAERAKDGVRATRFPRMYSCPGCGSLAPFQKFNSPAGKAECSLCLEDLVPSRFVVACENGHLDDFPYWRWVHRGAGRTIGPCGGTLSLRAQGSTASLRGVVVSCSCGVAPVSMEGAFRRKTVEELGLRCTGRLPWLKDAPDETCGLWPRTLQRGSSSVWFPVMHSALSIPPWSEGLAKLVSRYYDELKNLPREDIPGFLLGAKVLNKHPEYSPDEVVELVDQWSRAEEAAEDAEKDPPQTLRAKIYRDEYDTLRRTYPERADAEHQDFVCEPPTSSVLPLTRSYGIEQIMLVERLREVRALESFTRVEEPGAVETTARRARISRTPQNWLPAMEVSGEGVFVRLDEDRLREWEQRAEPAARARRLRENHQRLLAERTSSAAGPVPGSPATPRFLLLHSLAHILINEWSLDGGYPAAALRERLYVDKDMAGILIYTATSDSAGSLGGIVSQGEPDRLAGGLRAALHRANWCSNDPLCMEAEASGADGLNLAACHACLLLPETSCENNNILLDRAALVGTPDGLASGFFGLPAEL